MADPLGPTGFWSYTSSDDLNSDGRLSQLRVLLTKELQTLIGQRPRVHIFQDVAAIPRGSDWVDEIRKALTQSSFFIPVVTPGFLHSHMCCQELMLFRQREIELGRKDLIFPFHYVEIGHLDPTRPEDVHDPEALKLLRERQVVRFQDLRLKEPGHPDVRPRIAELAEAIHAAMRRTVVPIVPGPAVVSGPPTAPTAPSSPVAPPIIVDAPREVVPPPAPADPPGAAPPLGEAPTIGGANSGAGARVSGSAASSRAASSAVPGAMGRGFPGRTMLGLAAVAALAVLGMLATGVITRGSEPPAKVALVAQPLPPPSKPTAEQKPVVNPSGPVTAVVPNTDTKPSAVASPVPTPQPAPEPALYQKPLPKPPDPVPAPKPEPAPFSSIWAKSCDTCPEFELVLIPAGTVNLGVSKAEIDKLKFPDWEKELVRSGGEPRSVPIGEKFYLGRTHVTRAQFQAFMDNKTVLFPAIARDAVDKCLASFDGDSNKAISNKDQHPIVCVSHDDAMAYIKWLNKGNMTGPYRLPSEVEWEYAARGERVMKSPSPARYWEPGDACLNANVADASLAGSLKAAQENDSRYFGCDDGYRGTSPVGKFRRNSFELNDMLGNAWQWVADCYLPSYDEPRIVNATPRNTTQGCQRVLRGGSSYNIPWIVRAGSRNGNSPDIRIVIIGFRVARTLSLP